ncbi:hypothetical protein Godav_014126, partial [Gossypium davidsonii]|nr:hypothetical protein [Gossypium davidsonii]
MAACIYPSKNIATPAMAEAWACLHAVKFGEDLGFRDNCVKGDSLIVIKGINDAKDDKSRINNVLKAVQNKINNFTHIKFRFVPCLANNAAHTLAKAGWHHEQPEYWMEEAPASVVEWVERERTGNETG